MTRRSTEDRRTKLVFREASGVKSFLGQGDEIHYFFPPSSPKSVEFVRIGWAKFLVLFQNERIFRHEFFMIQDEHFPVFSELIDFRLRGLLHPIRCSRRNVCVDGVVARHCGIVGFF